MTCTKRERATPRQHKALEQTGLTQEQPASALTIPWHMAQTPTCVHITVNIHAVVKGGFACANITTKAHKVLWSVGKKRAKVEFKHIRDRSQQLFTWLFVSKYKQERIVEGNHSLIAQKFYWKVGSNQNKSTRLQSRDEQQQKPHRALLQSFVFIELDLSIEQCDSSAGAVAVRFWTRAVALLSTGAFSIRLGTLL